jgi:hypothetical protein
MGSVMVHPEEKRAAEEKHGDSVSSEEEIIATATSSPSSVAPSDDLKELNVQGTSYQSNSSIHLPEKIPIVIESCDNIDQVLDAEESSVESSHLEYSTLLENPLTETADSTNKLDLTDKETSGEKYIYNDPIELEKAETLENPDQDPKRVALSKLGTTVPIDLEADYDEVTLNRRSTLINADERPVISKARFSLPANFKSGFKKEKIKPVPKDQTLVMIFDSLNIKRSGTIKTLKSYLQYEAMDKMQAEVDMDRIKGLNLKVPNQPNSSDCGIYLINFVDQFFQDTPKNLELAYV